MKITREKAQITNKDKPRRIRGDVLIENLKDRRS